MLCNYDFMLHDLLILPSGALHASSSFNINSKEVEILAFLAVQFFFFKGSSAIDSKLWTATLIMLLLLADGILMGACTISMAAIAV